MARQGNASLSGWLKRGTEQPAAVLDDDKVREIRRLYAQGGRTCWDLGSQYGVSGVVISRVVNRKSWKHVA
jgi:hypothetical protein